MATMTTSGSKTAALKASRTLNPCPQAVVDEVFSSSVFLDPHDLVQVKYEMVRRVRVDGVPVTRAAAAFGFCRQSFYVIAAALDAGGPAALVPGKPGPKGPRKLTEEVMEFLEELIERDTPCGRGSWRMRSRIASVSRFIRARWRKRWPGAARTAPGRNLIDPIEVVDELVGGDELARRYEDLRAAVLGGPDRGGSRVLRPSGGRERDLLPEPDGLSVALPAT